MSNIENRPFVGTWTLNNKQVVKHTPDCVVYVNGDTSLPGCVSCGGRIDIQKYITQVSVDNSTDPNPGSCSISMHIPKHVGDMVFRDGNYLLHPGLEVQVYMRGYFPVKGVFDSVPTDETDSVDLKGSVSYPYYQVFHGVVDEVQHDYTSGEHTASLTCKDMMHFWSHHRLSQSAAIFAAAPSQSKLKTTLVGNNFAGMNAYAIVWNLFRDVMGAAGGAEFALGNATNVSANSNVLSTSMWHAAMLYWEKRFSQTLTSLRMYGTNGRLFSAFEQALLKDFKALDTQKLRAIQAADTTIKTNEKNPFSNQMLAARALGFRPDVFYADFASERDITKASSQNSQYGINTANMTAFTMDISAMGSVNLFESVYLTKLDIIQKVCEVTGYEFYVDVDGDFVFKPPFYNLDTSSSRVYRIEPIDIISFNTVEREPEVTALKGTGGHFQNLTGTGLEGNEWGTRAEYIDYRLVAKYGWRPQSFETSYFTDPRAQFYSAVARMDVYNIQMNSASCSIPYRPELRVGYPIYVVHLDCFYYIQALSHSFSFGGQCTTNLTLVGKRAKFYPPGTPSQDGQPVTTKNIKLDSIYLPELPLVAKSQDSNLPRQVGMPNVVMAIDPDLMNPLAFAANGLDQIKTKEDVQKLVLAARLSGVLNLADAGEDPLLEGKRWLTGPFVLSTGPDTEPITIPSVDQLAAQAEKFSAVSVSVVDSTGTTPLDRLATISGNDGGVRELTLLLDLTQTALRKLYPEAGTSANYMTLLNDKKASFAPNVPGYYRYYSCSHPDIAQQGQKRVKDFIPGAIERLDAPLSVVGLKDAPEGVQLGQIPVLAGLPVIQPGAYDPTSNRYLPPSIRAVPTRDVQTLSFVDHAVTKTVMVATRVGGSNGKFDPEDLRGKLYWALHDVAVDIGAGDAWLSDTGVGKSIEIAYNLKRGKVLIAGLGFNYPEAQLGAYLRTYGDVYNDAIVRKALSPEAGTDPKIERTVNPQEQAALWAGLLSTSLARDAASMFNFLQNEFSSKFGALNESAKAGTTEDEKTAAYNTLFTAWDAIAYDIEQEQSRVPTRGKLGVIKKTPKDLTTHYQSLAFPISDSSGYTVIGGYRYGRGLSIEPGGNFETLQKNTPFTQKDYASVEAFVSALTSDKFGGSIVKVMKSGDVSDVAKETLLKGIAEGLTTLDTKTQQELREIVDRGELGDRFREGFANAIATQRQAPDKLSVVNAAYSLADIGNRITPNVCSCKGSEADVLLQAFAYGQTFVSVQPDEVSSWVADQMASAGSGWQQSRKAMQGEIQRDPVEAAKTAYSALREIDTGRK